MRGGMRHKAVLALGCVLLVAGTAACSEDVHPTDRGMTYLEQGDDKKAIDAFDEAIRQDPQDAIAYYNRGVAYNRIAQGVTGSGMVRAGSNISQYQSAIQDFDQAIRLNPQADAYFNRGFAYRNLGQFERAIEEFDEALRLNPQHAEAYYNRGAGYGSIGKSIEAERDFAKAKDLGYPP
jgi:tetratricopeptide (TPR) repeat protein